MIVYLGLPNKNIGVFDKELKDITQYKLDLQPLMGTTLGVGGTLILSEKLELLERIHKNCINNVFSYLIGNFQEELERTNLPTKELDYESNFKIHNEFLPLRNQKRTTIDEYILQLEYQFVTAEKEFLKLQPDYCKFVKQIEIDKRKLTGDLKECCLNNIVEKSEFEFLKLYYFVRKKDQPFNKIFLNEKISSIKIDKIIEDDSYEMLSFYGMKSAENEIREIIKNENLIYKDFLIEDDFKMAEINLRFFEEKKKEHFDFLVNFFEFLVNIYAGIKFSKTYLDCILYYGIPADYSFYCLRSKKKKEMHKFLQTLVMEEEENENLGEIACSDLRLPIYDC